MTKKAKSTSVRLLVLPTQLSSKESGSESGCDEDDFSTVGLQDGAKESTNIGDKNFVQSMDEDQERVCGDSASLSGLTKVC